MRLCTATLALMAGIAVFLAGCSKNETRSSVMELEKTFQLDKPKPAAAQPAPQSSDPSVPIQGGRVEQAVSYAVTAMKTNGYVEAFATLRSIQAAPNLTLDQYSAIANARLAVEKELAERAVRGDPAAMKAIENIRRIGR
jgi:hypothetical protein